jgi:hypothetical protein
METRRPARTSGDSHEERGFRRKLSLGLLALALLTPLGLVLPRVFHAEGTWGEWGPEHLRKTLGYVPERLGRSAHVWHAPAAGYSFSKDGACLASQLFFYIIAGLAGITIIALAVVLLARIVRTNER